MKTKKLYYEDQYLREFDAQIVEITTISKKQAIVLSQTAFYPVGGGEPADKGTISGYEVKDVVEKDDIIYHFVDGHFNIGDMILGKIDWGYRYSLMQHHTGEHIISGIVKSKFGYDNIGFHMGKDFVTLDFNGELSKTELQDLEQLANQVVMDNVDVSIDFPNKDILNVLDYRSKKELEGDIRIVSVDKFDCCACCGLHVSHTSEVGIIKFLSSQKNKTGIRISILCAKKAIEYINVLMNITSEVSAMLSANTDKITTSLSKLKDENISLKNRLSKSLEQLVNLKVESIKISQQDKNVIYEESLITLDEVRMITLGLAKKTEGVVAVISFDQTENIYYALSSSKIDVRPITKSLNDKFFGKGGGSAVLTQGTLKYKNIDEVNRYISQNLAIF